MKELFLVALAGFLAAGVDGALGMGFGPTSSSLLLTSGLSPAATSATVNLAKVVTGVAGGISHWRFGNVDRRLVLRLALPGCVGALVGASVLATVDGDTLEPVLALLLMAVGLRILWRFSRPLPARPDDRPDAAVAPTDRGVEVAAATGGVTNGLVGAWGPVVTPYLLARGVAPRHTVGSVNTAEVAVAVVSVGSLLGALGGGGIEPAVVAAMLVGGVLGAPLAAWLVRLAPPRLLGLAVAGLLLATQSRTLASSALDLPGNRWVAYVTVPLVVAAAAARPRLERRLRPAAT